MRNLRGARWRYSRKLRRKCGLRSKLLVRAFAEVPREFYLGAPPWPILTLKGYRPISNPHRLYDDVLVGIVPKRGLNNGQPSGLASWFDALDLKRNSSAVHIGAGVGYYSAIIAHVLGPGGHLRAIEIDDTLAPRAKQNLAHLRQVEFIHGDGTKLDLGHADAIFVNAGANYPLASWLDAMNPGARLIFPLTAMRPMNLPLPTVRVPAASNVRRRHRRHVWYGVRGGGVMIRVTRESDRYRADLISAVGIFPCIGAVSRETDDAAASSLMRGDYESIKFIRRDSHEAGPACWLHHDGACISSE
jgi:protein-L-isoaspartate(D-aspartate) O-methyltransferase